VIVHGPGPGRLKEIVFEEGDKFAKVRAASNEPGPSGSGLVTTMAPARETLATVIKRRRRSFGFIGVR
jgi:hypothetical protein